jgi:hypothetical protein
LEVFPFPFGGDGQCDGYASTSPQKKQGGRVWGTIEFVGDGSVVLNFLESVVRGILNGLLYCIDDECVICLKPTLKTHQLLIENILLINRPIKFILCLSPQDIWIMIRVQRRRIRLRNGNPLAQRLRQPTLKSAPTHTFLRLQIYPSSFQLYDSP